MYDKLDEKEKLSANFKAELAVCKAKSFQKTFHFIEFKLLLIITFLIYRQINKLLTRTS